MSIVELKLKANLSSEDHAQTSPCTYLVNEMLVILNRYKFEAILLAI